MILIDTTNIAQLKDVVSLSDDAACGSGWECQLFTAHTASLVDAPAPEPWQAGCWQWDAQAGVWRMVAVPQGYAAWARERIDADRAARIAAGMPYDFSDGRGTVQLRNETDIINVTGVGTSGLMLTVAGDTTTKLIFRDKEDVTHTMDGVEAQAFGLGVSAWISAHYSRAWDLKTEVDAALALADETERCQKLATLDFDTGWPATATGGLAA